MVSRTTRYALQILGYLAARGEERVAGEEIARATGIPANYLSKILNLLRKNDLVDSQKGWGGGFSLRREALGRPIADVLAAIEGANATVRTECLFGLPSCDCENPCPLHSYWESIRQTYNTMLREVTVGDLGRRTA
ncbi:MAG: Rrf2 family transcriptional regulator [Thermoanaerobaculales bacterium]|jgi:Rrf2 family protein|nr:Rrf2 family transcriptional regulator [Thermoanaerobaculales bacterium]